MKLDIIVPHFKEDTKTVLRALMSIEMQCDTFFEKRITVVTDFGGVEINEDLIKSAISNNIEFITTDRNGGPGYARQYALERTSGDWIIFCDSDDMFASPFAFGYFADQIKENDDLEVIYTAYLEEFPNNGDFLYNQKDDDVSITCLHGKMYRRSFLEEHGIKFPNLMISEDGAFNFRCVCHAKKIIFNDDVCTYIWKYNPNSLTRKDTSFTEFPVNVRSFAESIAGFSEFFNETINSQTSIVSTKVICPFIKSLYKQLDALMGIPVLVEENIEELKRVKEKLDACAEKYKEYMNEG